MRQLGTTFACRFVILLSICVLTSLLASPAFAVKRIYLANDDHTDYFWAGDDVQYRAAFLSMLDFYMAQAEATATQPSDSRGRFNVDGSLWVWEYEHNKTPAQFARLIDHMRAGDITMPLNTAVLCYGGSPAEGVLRSMYYPGRLERRYGMRFPLVEAMENQTLPGGIASLWAGSGAKYSWRGVCGCVTQTAFAPRARQIYNFLGPDGQGVCMKWNTQLAGLSGIGSYLESSSPAGMVSYLDADAGFKAVWPWDVSGAFGYGGDALQTTTGAFVSTAQSYSNASRRVIVSNEVDFFQDFLANHGSEIPNFSGSFGNEWDLYQASMAAVTSAFRSELEKLRTAEALATIASWNHPAFMTGRESARDAAFMAAGLFYEHDWTADGPVLRSRRAQFQRDQLTLLKNYVDKLQADALAVLAADVSTISGKERHAVFNPLSWSRTDAVDLTTSIASPRRVIDVATGAEVRCQEMSASVVRILAANVPSVGYRVYEVQAQAPATFPASATVTLPVMDNALYRVTVGTRGNITSLIDHRDGDRQWVNGTSGSALNDLGTGAGSVVVESTGPVSTTLRVTAGGTPAHETRVTLYADVDRVDVENTVTQNFSGTLAYESTFNLVGAKLRHEEVGMIATVARTAQGGDYADANTRTDYLSFGHFADFSEPTRGITVSNADCSFFQAGNSSVTSLDGTTPSIKAVVGMQVDGTGLGIAAQGGDTRFVNRFAFQRHGAYDPAGAMRVSLEHQDPLIEARLTGTPAGVLPSSTYSFVAMPSSDVLLWALKPAEEGIAAGIIARVWNVAQGQRSLALSMPVASHITATRTTHLETDIGPAPVASEVLTETLEPQQLRTYRIVALPALNPLAVPLGGDTGLRLAAFPNPVRAGTATSISFRLDVSGHVRLRVCDLRGATVAVLCEWPLAAGPQRFVWNHHDGHGHVVPSGIYFVDLNTGTASAHSRIAVLK